MNVEKVAEDLTSLTIKELIELKKVLKDKYGIEYEPVTVVNSVVEKEPEKKVEEKTEFDIKLTRVSEVTKERLDAVKLVNQLTNVGLKEAMNLVKSLPSILKEKVPKLQAEEFKSKLVALNAEVELI